MLSILANDDSRDMRFVYFVLMEVRVRKMEKKIKFDKMCTHISRVQLICKV